MFSHWGTFTKVASLQNCLSIAQNALQKEHFQVWDTANDGDYLVIGGNNDTVVTIVCVPQRSNVWIVVSACSNDSAKAEQARNSVRADIVNTVIIDQGSAGVPASG